MITKTDSFKWIVSLLLLALIGTVNIGCTRQGGDGVLKIQLPTNSQNGSLVSADELFVVIINLRVPGSEDPLYAREIEYKNSGLTMGSTVTIEVPAHELPKLSNLKVQYLGVHESSAGTLSFTYGDTIVDSTKAGDIPANINATNIGVASKLIEVGGRYLTSQGPDSGPTGTLIGDFLPPGAETEPMAVMKDPIIDGWFNIFFLDGDSKFRYRLKETGEALFPNLNYATATAAGGLLDASSADNKIAGFSRPQMYRKDHDGLVQSETETLFYLGYFQKPGSGLNISSYKVCYVNQDEGVPRMYTDSALENPLVFKGSGGGGPTDAKVIAGGNGTATSVDSLAATCDTSGGSNLVFYHQHINNEFEAALGVKPPFAAVNPYAPYSSFLSGYFDGTSSIVLNWKSLPGVVSSGAIAGYKILRTQYTGGGGGDDGGGIEDETCQRFIEEGYIEVGSTTSDTFTHNGGYTDQNYWDYSFIVCPFRSVAGVNEFLSGYARNHCYGGCDDIANTGRGAIDRTLSSNSSFSATGATGMNGASQRVINIGAGPTPDTIELTLPSTPSANYIPGSEIMLIIVGQGNNGCGSNHLQPGWTDFSRLISVSGNNLRILKGTEAEIISNTNLAATASAVGTFCQLAAVRVPHFRNLTISNNIYADPFTYNATAQVGGIIALRVSGTLTLSHAYPLDAGAAGYRKATYGTDTYGGGLLGPAGNNPTVSGGGPAGAFGSGGGGYGSGGLSATSPDHGRGLQSIMGGGGGNMGVLFQMGGGGGVDAATSGGHGGGMIFVVANKIAATTTASLKSYGEDGSSGAGGGGGGSINVLVNKVDPGSSAISFLAQGGDSPGSGGGGGGGYIRALACEDTGNILTPAAAPGGAGGGANGVGGNTDTYATYTQNPINDSDRLYYCENH